ncbi:MAG TPA: phage holin family protein [Tepidisphaeraceae bacterium]|jgi:predicted lipid-binding transport protein (Tim44 family)|nr:phage holin family protein [Tepidisphaeraceae bacterium]
MPIETPPRFSTEPEPATGATTDSVKSAFDNLKEAQAYLVQYISAKTDGFKSSARNLALYAVLGVVAAFVGLTATITATVLLMVGIAGALGALFGGMFWLANLLVGLLFIGALVGGVLLLMRMMAKRSREQTERKYEAMHRRQHMNFGHTAAERAHQPDGVQPEHING